VHRLSAGGAGGGSFGASRTFIVGSVLLAAPAGRSITFPAASPKQLFLLYGAVGLCVGVVGAVPYVMVRAFPAEVRLPVSHSL
jgi:hypothetical protein